MTQHRPWRFPTPASLLWASPRCSLCSAFASQVTPRQFLSCGKVSSETERRNHFSPRKEAGAVERAAGLTPGPSSAPFESVKITIVHSSCSYILYACYSKTIERFFFSLIVRNSYLDSPPFWNVAIPFHQIWIVPSENSLSFIFVFSDYHDRLLYFLTCHQLLNKEAKVA